MQTPLADKAWEGTVAAKEFYPKSQDIRDDILKRIKIDNNADPYVYKFIDESISQKRSEMTFDGPDVFKENDTCERKVEFIKNRIMNTLAMWPDLITYQFTAATPAGAMPKTSVAFPTIVNTPTLYKQQVDKSLSITWGHGSTATGNLKVNLAASFTCRPDSNVGFKITIPDYEIINPNLWLTNQQIATLFAKWDQISDTMKYVEGNLSSLDMNYNYQKKIDKAAREIQTSLKERYKKLPEVVVNLKEVTLKVPYEVVTSRIQRRLDSYKFIAGNSRYEFYDTLKVGNETADLKIILKIFPEEGGKTASILSVSYTPIMDRFRHEKAFGEAEAREYLNNQSNFITKIILNK